MTFDLGSLLLFGLPLGACAGLLVYALSLRNALKNGEAQAQTSEALCASLRNERDLAIQNAIRLEAELDADHSLFLFETTGDEAGLEFADRTIGEAFAP